MASRKVFAACRMEQVEEGISMHSVGKWGSFRRQKHSLIQGSIVSLRVETIDSLVCSLIWGIKEEQDGRLLLL